MCGADRVNRLVLLLGSVLVICWLLLHIGYVDPIFNPRLGVVNNSAEEHVAQMFFHVRQGVNDSQEEDEFDTNETEHNDSEDSATDVSR